MRVIAGQYRSRNIESLPGRETRPTYDRLKETLFNVVHAAGLLDGARFLDLYAGTGSIGIEALSRGASHATFVESSRKAVRVIEKNLESLAIGEEARVIGESAAEALAQLSRMEEKFDIIFLDPPYEMQGEYERALRLIDSGGLAKEGTVVIAEHDKRFDPGEEHGKLKRYRVLEQGESKLSFYRKSEG